jgi:hypothetical protein
VEDKPVGRPYEGPSGIGRDSTWLTAEDLVDGRDVVVKIKRVILYPKVKFEAGRERTNMLGLEFVGKERVLGLNATNRKSLNAQFGNITKSWVGQEVTLFVSETQMKGETVKCIRIRNQRSRAATAAETFLESDDDVNASQHDAEANGAGDDSPQARFAQGCGVLDLDAKESAALLRRHGGDYEKACVEVDSMVNKKLDVE